MENEITLPAFLLSKLINEQGGIFCLLHEKLHRGWKGNLKNLSEHALLLGTSEYSWIAKETRMRYSASSFAAMETFNNNVDTILGFAIKSPQQQNVLNREHSHMTSDF